MNIVDYEVLQEQRLELLSDIQSGKSIIVKNLPEELYHSIDSHLGSTKIVKAFRSMQHMMFYEAKSGSTELFRAFHCILLEGVDMFNKKFTFLDDEKLKAELKERLDAIENTIRSTQPKATKTLIKESQKGVNITNLKKEKKELYLKQGVSVLSENNFLIALDFKKFQEKRTNSLLNTFIENGISELSFFCKCPETGLLLKGRGDNVNLEKFIITDLKGVLSPSVENTDDYIERLMQAKGYFWQACHYRYILHTITQNPFTFLHFLHETAAPFIVKGSKYDDDSFNRGKVLLIKKYKEIKEYLANPKEEPQEELIETRHWFKEEEGLQNA